MTLHPRWLLCFRPALMLGAYALMSGAALLAATSTAQARHPRQLTNQPDPTGLSVKFTDANGKVLTNLRLCAGEIDVFNGVEDSVHAATITITLMKDGKVLKEDSSTALLCSFEKQVPPISGRAVPPKLRNPADAGRALSTSVPLKVEQGAADLRVVSSNLISRANLVVRLHPDTAPSLGTLPCTFAQSYGKRYSGVIAANPQGFSMAPRPNPPNPLGVGDEITVYNRDYDSDHGWDYSPLVLTSPGEVMTATLHLTFQRDLSVKPSRNYFLHNGQPVEEIQSNADVVNQDLPNGPIIVPNIVPVPGHSLSIKLIPFRKVRTDKAVLIQQVPTGQEVYYAFFGPTFTARDKRDRSLTTLVTSNLGGLAVISIRAGERINTCDHFELQVTDKTQFK